MTSLLLALFLPLAQPASCADEPFGKNLHQKFQVKACTTCHDFHDAPREGLGLKSHKGRPPVMCAKCHTAKVTGFVHEDDWFARPGLYMSGMTAKETCELIKEALNARFKSPALLARELEKHLLEDPRVLWSIDGATPNSGMLPGGKKDDDLVKGGLQEWTEQVRAWVAGGMKCE